MIIGTAGHIDHGKSQLIRTLTGVNTDRLAEEKKRGISIELGYAYQNIEGYSLGFIDVPGHEKFIHTMVAGASGLQGALVVVAADDGVMPQTREHLAILYLLGITEILLVCTKIDRADPKRIDSIYQEVAEICHDYGLRIREVIAVDAREIDHPGMQSLRQALAKWAQSRGELSSDADVFRMAIDRVFSVSGHGTVVTGTVHSGSVATEDLLTLQPVGASLRVRQIHAQNQEASRAAYGQRCALNITGIDKESIQRGQWLVTPDSALVTNRLDMVYTPLDGQPPSVWQPVHLHIGTYHTIGHMVPLMPVEGTLQEQVERNAWFVQIVCDDPLVVRVGDRMIIRNAQATSTIGGAICLDPLAGGRKRKTVARQQTLTAILTWYQTHNVQPWLAHSPFGISEQQLIQLTGKTLTYWNNVLASRTDITRIETKRGIVWFEQVRWQALMETILQQLDRFHQTYPQEPGVQTSRLARMCYPSQMEQIGSVWDYALQTLQQQKRIMQHKGWWALPTHAVVLAPADQPIAMQIMQALSDLSLHGVWVRDLSIDLNVPEDEVRRISRFLIRQAELLAIVPDLLITPAHITHWIDILRSVRDQEGEFSVIDFKEALQAGRKRSIQILECLDRMGFTRRRKEKRLLRNELL